MAIQHTYAKAGFSGPNEPASVSVPALLGALWRRRMWIAVPVVVLTGLAVLWLSSVTPLYRSTARVIVENRESAFTRPSTTVEERALLDQEAVKSQVQLILSADLSREVIRKEGLDRSPEFNPSGGRLLSPLLSLLGIVRDTTHLSQDQRILDRYYDRLTVYQVDNSRVIAIEFSSSDPEVAARVANAVADGYIAMQRAAKQEITRDAGDWLSSQIAQLTTKVDEAERKVEEFRSQHGLFSTLRGSAEPQTLSQQELSELTSQLALARAQKSEAQARARMIREMIESGRPIEASEVLNSALIQNLVTQQVTLTAQIAELSSTLGPLHPRMKELNAQLGDLRRQIREEAARFVRAAENDAGIAAEREQALLATLEALKDSAAEANENEVQLRALEREAKSQRDLLESMLARFREASAREDIMALPADARIISRAVPAARPYFPKTMATLIAVFLGSLVLSCGVVITLELARAAGQGAVVPVPALGDGRSAAIQVPHPSGPLPRMEVEPDRYQSLPIDPRIIALRDALIGGGADGWSAGEGTRTVLLTTIRRAAGAEAMALDLARAVSDLGFRVVVVHTEFAPASGSGDRAGDGKDAGPGLGEVLAGRADFETVIRRDVTSRVHVVPAGAATADPLLLIASDRMASVLDALQQTYDVLIMVAPSVDRRGEARLLARRAERAVLLVAGAPDDPAAQRACDRLEDAGVRQVEILSVDDIQGDGTRQSAA
jgi:succinoglycan biosynthesis transport protein ExoP